MWDWLSHSRLQVVTLAPSPTSVMKVFRPWQQDAFAYADGRHRIALFMEMRLGKSLVAIHWTRTLPPPPDRGLRILALIPMEGLYDWVEELRDADERFLDLTGISQEERWEILAIPTPGRTFYLLNYEAYRTCSWMHGASGAELFDAIILDESTKIRNPKAQITKILSRKTHIPYRAILTGQPDPEGPEDFYSQMEFLHGEFMGFYNFWHWRDSLFRLHPAGYTWIPRAQTIDRIQEELREKTFRLTRKQAVLVPEKHKSPAELRHLPSKRSG